MKGQQKNLGEAAEAMEIRAPRDREINVIPDCYAFYD
jgi:hypothetical protein